MSTSIQKARDRLASLIDVDAVAVAATRRSQSPDADLDNEMYMQWRMSAITVIKRLAPESHYLSTFESVRTYTPGFHAFNRQLAVLKALLVDLDGGHLSNLQGLLRAEIFGEFMEQAQHLFEEGYWQPAAVVAGSVLEDHLRKLCGKHPSITLPAKPKLDTMNAELTKAGEYNGLVQKRITYLADIRNNAAHGHWDRFTAKDAEDLIQSVLRFLTDHPL